MRAYRTSMIVRASLAKAPSEVIFLELDNLRQMQLIAANREGFFDGRIVKQTPLVIDLQANGRSIP